MPCSPQRYLANNKNKLVAATLTPSSVASIENQVIELPVARRGTGAAVIGGAYTGTGPATYDIQVLDVDPDNPQVTAVVATGQGSGTLVNASAFGVAQTFTIELQSDGIPSSHAGIDFEGVRIIARAAGAAGNTLALSIDQSGLTFTPQAFSLLSDLQAGIGGVGNGAEGPEFDWDAKAIGVDDLIPADAHRVSFGADTTNIYVQYKKFTDGEWRYHFVPAIKRTVPAGTVVNYVTGSRTVDVIQNGDSPPVESLAGIITVYDLLNAIKTSSAFLDVVGIVAYDRTPTGQASRELLLRTDAHCELSTGSGSKYATGFVNTSAGSNAATELVTAECFAVSSQDHPLARAGRERWHLKGSVSGTLGDIISGEPYTHPAGRFALTIPVKLPENYAAPTGRFTHVEPDQYVPRDDDDKPPICVVAMNLGPEAVDQTITLVWTERPSGDCACKSMRVPKLRKECLGIETESEGDDVGFQVSTVTKLTALYNYYSGVVRSNSSETTVDSYTVPVPAPFVEGAQEASTTLSANASAVFPASLPRSTEEFRDVIELFADALIAMDVLTGGELSAGHSAWDTAFTELQGDVDDSTPELRMAVDFNIYESRIGWVYASAGLDPTGKSNASDVVSGDGCWRDMGGNYWTVTGSDKGAYAPAFNGAPYYGSRLASDGRTYFSTKEFGFQINIACPEKLVFGDTVVLVIGDAGKGSSYQVGDLLTLPVVSGQSLQLAGGQNGSGVLDFYVSGSIDGAFPNYSYNPSSPAPYVQTGVVEFLYQPGGIPNKKGDKWTFALEGGHYRWRKNGGGWITDSPLGTLDVNPQPLDAGLTIRFEPGAAPSFATDDIYSFRVLQPWAVDQVKYPGPEKWKWAGATATLDADLGSVVPITAGMLARHTLPQGATVTLHGGDAAANEWSESFTWREGVMFKDFAAAARTARFLQWSIAGAADKSIGWAWAGVPDMTELQGDVQVRPVYRIETGTQGLDQGGRYLARSVSCEVKFSEASLGDPDVEKMMAMIDNAKRNNDEPIVIVPNVLRPDEAYLVQIAVDEFSFEESSGQNAEPGVRERRYDIGIPFTGVWNR